MGKVGRLSKVLAGLLVSGVVFWGGCQTERSVEPENKTIQYVRPRGRTQMAAASYGQNDSIAPGRSGYSAEPMVQLTSFELAQASDGGYPGNGQTGDVVGFTLTGKSKWETLKSDLLELPGVAWENTKAVAKKPENLLLLGVAGGLSIWGELDFDNRVDRQLAGRQIVSRDLTIVTGAAGNPGTHFALAAGIYAHGLLSENNTTYDFGKTLTHALVLNGLVTMGLKVAVWNHSPNDELFGWPSGHTSSTMTVASVVHEYYGLLPAAPLYALTGLVMYERMITSEHWASDVIFGAALGYVIGHTVAGEKQMQVFGMDVIPYSDPYLGASGIGLVKTW